MLAGVSLSGALLATPSLKVTNAQGNETAQGNQSVGMQTQGTKGLPVDAWIKVLKDKNPDSSQCRTKSRCEGRYWKDKSNERPKRSS